MYTPEVILLEMVPRRDRLHVNSVQPKEILNGLLGGDSPTFVFLSDEVGPFFSIRPRTC